MKVPTVQPPEPWPDPPASASADDRVYLLRAQALELEGGSRLLFAAGYHQLPAELAERWRAEGLALSAAEYEAHLAEAAAAAQADPVMHPAAPRIAIPAGPAPAGIMWPQGPKGQQHPAAGAAEASPVQGPAPAPPRDAGSAEAQPSAESQEE